MQTFLATLAQVSATLLGIFLASVTAYFVFLNERFVTYSEQIGALQVDVAADLSQLNAVWPSSSALFFLPPQFLEIYRKKHPTTSQAALLIQLSADLVFRSGELVDVVRQANPAHPETAWEGRLYFSIISQLARALGAGNADRESGVFPASPGGPGFDQWRNEFKQLQGTIELLRMLQSSMLLNLRSSLEDQSEALRQQLGANVGYFFQSIERLQSKLTQIDKLTLLAKNYRISDRVSWVSLATTSILWFFLGVILPLGLLAFPQAEIKTLAGAGILVGTLLFGFISVVQFGIDIQQKPFDRYRYVVGRWYQPILEQLRQQETNLGNGGFLEISQLYDALNSDERNYFDDEIKTALDDSLRRAEEYNDKATGFNRTVVETIREHRVLGPLVSGYTSLKGGPLLYPYQFASPEQQFRDLVFRWESSIPNSEQDISVETVGLGWNHVELKIPGDKFYKDPKSATVALEEVRKAILPLAVTSEFIDAKGQLEHALSELRRMLDAKLDGKRHS